MTKPTNDDSAPWFLKALRCLRCRKNGTLALSDRAATCGECGASWALVDGIPAFADGGLDIHQDESAAEVEREVRKFYEKNPFPTYADFDSVGSLLEKARQGHYGKMLDDQLPTGIRVLECGCGTGQLSSFLSISSRYCLGIDMCLASLKCGKDFKDRHHLERVAFVQGNIFDLPVAESSFDLVISKGVLHHTADAKRAFLEIAKRVRPGGYLIVGLYNRYGRIPTLMRKHLYRVFPFLRRRGDYVMRRTQGQEKRRIWWQDQYNNPHETWHSVDEVLGWFREAGIEYVSSFPPITFEPDAMREKFFVPRPAGGALQHLLIQVGWIFTISREGALFDMFGRRPLPGDRPDRQLQASSSP